MPGSPQENPDLSTDRRHVLIGEIEFWLDSSQLFFEIFQLKQDAGKNWFLLNELVKYTELEFSVGQAAQALRARGIAGDNSVSDVSTLARHLESCNLIQIVGKKSAAGGAREVYTVGVRLRGTDTLRNKIDRYVRDFVKRIYETPTTVNDSIAVFRAIYDFMIDVYVREWESFLTQLARKAVDDTTGSETPLVSELCGSSEYFVLLLKLWEMHLKGDDRDGIPAKELQQVHPRIMALSDIKMDGHIDFMVRHRLMRKLNNVDRFVFDEKYDPIFAAYGERIVSHRLMLGKNLNLGGRHSAGKTKQG